MARASCAALLLGGVVLGPDAALAERRTPTTPTDIGIFYLPNAPGEANLWREGDVGERLYLQGRVLDRDNQPVADALVEMWHADALGGVDEQRYRTAQLSATDGAFSVRTVLPGHIARAVHYPTFAPRHIHVVVSHPDHPRLITLIYFRGDDRLALGTPYPELAIALEQSTADERTVLIGRVELILQDGW